MRDLRVVIVDDERLARSELRSMLEAYDGLAVVGEAADVPSAAKLIRRVSPDAVFLDILMSGKTGFDLLNEIDVECAIVFTTAFDEYAVRAFEVNACDYLMKPIRADRLDQAIERLSSRSAGGTKSSRQLRYSDTLLVRSGGRLRSLKVAEIVVIQAAGDYTEALTSRGTSELVHKTMKEWGRRLPADDFRRIHRSTIVNLRHVERFDESPRRRFLVYMKNIREPFEMSRRYAADLRRKMT